MNIRNRELADIAHLRGRARLGDTTTMLNIAAGYRILGRRVLAFRWWKRAADAGDGDALLEIAYAYQYGVGTRRNIEAAEIAYKSATQSRFISPFDREEAMYHLAVLLLSTQPFAEVRTRATELLRLANFDDDYPQAKRLMDALAIPKTIKLCACRRHLRPTLGRLQCALHRRKVL